MDQDEQRTRRSVLIGTGTAVGGALAGCVSATGTDEPASSASSDAETESPTPSPTATDGSPGQSTATEAETDAESTPETPYGVEMAPMGEVEFEAVPERIFTVLSHKADMALALGRGDDLTGVYAVEYTNSLMNAFTPRLDGVTVDWTDLQPAWNVGKETLYELDSDVHLADPAKMVTMGAWDRAGVEEVADRVGPFFGNTFSATHGTPPDAYADDYEYYTLWETFGKVAEVLRERERYEALAAVRADLLSTIESGLPPESERPSAAMVLPSTADDSMWTYRLNAPGYHAAHTRPLGATDAVAAAGTADNGAQIDYEALLAADPDVLFVLGGVVDAHDMTAIRETLVDDPIASSVTAVEEERVHALGTRHQGPLVNLFQTEMAAKQLYPEAFGEWPTYVEGAYPDLSDDQRLFDHDRVAAVITDGQ
mgnify:CR=1 FL=1